MQLMIAYLKQATDLGQSTSNLDLFDEQGLVLTYLLRCPVLAISQMISQGWSCCTGSNVCILWW